MRLTSAVVGVIALGAVALTPSAALADPDIDDVRAQVDDLYHQAEQASERRNDARIELRELRADLEALQSDEADQSAGLETLRSQVAESVLAQSQGGSSSPLAEAVLNGDASDFLDQVTTLSTYNDIQAGMVDSYTTGLDALEIRREATAERVAEIAAVERTLDREKRTIDTRLDEAEELLADLEAEEREALFAAQAAPSTPAGGQGAGEQGEQGAGNDAGAPRGDVPVSGRAAAAVQYAIAQVGKAYVYGASGPDAFDCSGLTSMAWAQAGVSLPHSSSAQFSTGTKVDQSALQPGDLVFYYSPISHVGIYIGNGQIVHAANPGTGVAYAGVNSMPFSGAVRPG